MITISRYRQTRHWGVWQDGRLIAVTVYRKGAVAVAALCESLATAQPRRFA